jgi:hypothetical protein
MAKVKIGNRIIDTSYIVDARYDPQAPVIELAEEPGLPATDLLVTDPRMEFDTRKPYLAMYMTVDTVLEMFGEAASGMWAALIAESTGEIKSDKMGY